MATSRAALSAPVWPPDMILVRLLGKILDVRGKFKGFDLAFEDSYLPISVEITR